MNKCTGQLLRSKLERWISEALSFFIWSFIKSIECKNQAASLPLTWFHSERFLSQQIIKTCRRSHIYLRTDAQTDPLQRFSTCCLNQQGSLPRCLWACRKRQTADMQHLQRLFGFVWREKVSISNKKVHPEVFLRRKDENIPDLHKHTSWKLRAPPQIHPEVGEGSLGWRAVWPRRAPGGAILGAESSHYTGKFLCGLGTSRL